MVNASQSIWLEHRVSYGETDAMGIVYYAEYLHMFERARSEFIRMHGMSYRQVEEQGILLPVREASCRYRSPARFDDLLHIKTTIQQWKRASLIFVYEIWNEERTLLLTEGMTEHACVSPAGKPTRAPEWLRELFSLRVPSVM